MKNRFVSFLFGIILIFPAVPASADLLTFDLDIEFSGATPPAGSTPWITATFDDMTGNPNSVFLTLSAANLNGVEFIDEWLFNFDPSLDPSFLTIGPLVENDTIACISLGTNSFGASGGGYYDIKYDFPQSYTVFRFTSGEMVSYELLYNSSIDISSFDFDSDPHGGNGIFTSAAHIQGIAPNGVNSGWIAPNPNPNPVPESATLLLLGVGLIVLSAFGSKIY